MSNQNQSLVTEIILLGFTKDLKINIFLFVLFLVVYLVTVCGNCLIIGIILQNHHLHVPMYYFLCMLSVFDLSYSTTVVPRMLSDFLSSRRVISGGACVIQVYLNLILGGCECLLLAIMAYDRYVAICQPLHYHVLMRWSVCYRLTAMIFFLTFVIFIFPSLFFTPNICHNQINHFMCDILGILNLACDNISSNELTIFCFTFITLLLPFVLIIISYICILTSVFKIQSAGRAKAFSTCSSHLGVVGLYFGTGMVLYFSPSSQYSSEQQKYSSIFYVIVSPMLNPIIYSLNNKEVKETVGKLLSTHVVSQRTIN